MPVNAGSLALRPLMDLTFRVSIARMQTSAPTGRNMAVTNTWTLNPRLIPCDIAPLKDDLYFAQSGTENIATHTIHFYANTDVNPKDIVHVLSSRRLAGPIGSWFEIQTRLEPTETLAYVRCYARVTDEPAL